MLAGIYYGSQYGGSTTSILLRIPGEAASVMTCIDGNAMAQEGPRRRRALHRRRRLVHRRHLRRHRAHAGGAAARRLRAALRPAGIHRAAGARPDLPRLHVDDVADPHAADGGARAAARHHRHRRDDRPFPLRVRTSPNWATASASCRSRSACSASAKCSRRRAVRSRTTSPRRRCASCCRRARNGAQSAMADRARLGARLPDRHHPGLRAHHLELHVLCAGAQALAPSGGIRQGRGRRRRRAGIRQQRRLDRRVRADAGARAPDRAGDRGADGGAADPRRAAGAERWSTTIPTCSGASSRRCMSAT